MFSSLTSYGNFTFNHLLVVVVFFFLYCCAQDGLYPLKLRARFRFLGYIRRLRKKQIIIINKNKKTGETSRRLTNWVMA